MLRFGLILAGVVLALDQISKYLILQVADLNSPVCFEAGINCGFIEISPIFDLHMVWNRGISFGLLQADSPIGRWGLVIAMLAIATLFASWLRTAERRVTGVALGLVIGGALGNVIDRIRFGAVVDFLDFNGLYFPWVFNVADAAISVGGALIVVDMFFFAPMEPDGLTGWQMLRKRLRPKTNP